MDKTIGSFVKQVLWQLSHQCTKGMCVVNCVLDWDTVIVCLGPHFILMWVALAWQHHFTRWRFGTIKLFIAMPVEWKVMYMSVGVVGFVSFYDSQIRFWNYSDGVVLFDPTESGIGLFYWWRKPTTCRKSLTNFIT